MNLPIIDDGVRPAGDPNKCFYCGSPKGQAHTTECVCLQRSVVVTLTLDYVVSVPRYWTKDDVEFHRNESSWCTNNFIGELGAIEDTGHCLCQQAKFTFVREATEVDHEFLHFVPEKANAQEGEQQEGSD